MKRSLLLGAVAVLTLGSTVASGQGAARPDVNDSSQTPSRRPPRLGVTVDIRVRDTDSIGAFVEAVAPRSPAEQAGIRAGDIITRLDERPVAETSGLPSAGMRLATLAARLKPNTSVSVELRRGKRKQMVSVVTPPEITLVFQGSRNDSGRGWSFRIPAADSETMGGRDLITLFGSPLASIETAALNPELGAYFGTSDGILVVKCPPETGIKLKGGDVVLAVNGRKPSTPAELMRLLQGHSNEPTELSVLRHRKRLDVTLPRNTENNGR